jgi:hypothetical protein
MKLWGSLDPTLWGGDGITEAEIMTLVKRALHDSDAFEAFFQQYQPMLIQHDRTLSFKRL